MGALVGWEPHIPPLMALLMPDKEVSLLRYITPVTALPSDGN